MFTHDVKYFDFNGNERNETLQFHLSTPEVTRIEAEIGTTIGAYVENLTAEQDQAKLLGFIERMVLNSYGKKTGDGRSFHKSKELRTEFEYSQAYAEFFEQLILNHELARKFGEGVADNGKNRKNQVAPQVVQ